MSMERWNKVEKIFRLCSCGGLSMMSCIRVLIICIASDVEGGKLLRSSPDLVYV